MLPTLTLLFQIVQQPEVSSISPQHRVVRKFQIMCYMVEIHAYMQCLNYCLVYGYIYCLHHIAFIHRILNDEFERKKVNLVKKKERIWWYGLSIRCTKFMYLWLMYATEMILRCISMFSKRMSCHPPLREDIMGFNIGPYYGDCCWELSRGNWGPCKPHLTTGCALGMYMKTGFPDIWIFIFKNNIIFKSSSLHKTCFVRIIECHWALAHFVYFSSML